MMPVGYDVPFEALNDAITAGGVLTAMLMLCTTVYKTLPQADDKRAKASLVREAKLRLAKSKQRQKTYIETEFPLTLEGLVLT